MLTHPELHDMGSSLLWWRELPGDQLTQAVKDYQSAQQQLVKAVAWHWLDKLAVPPHGYYPLMGIRQLLAATATACDSDNGNSDSGNGNSNSNSRLEQFDLLWKQRDFASLDKLIANL